MLSNKAKDFLRKYQAGGFTNVDNFTQNNQNKYLTNGLSDMSPLQQLPTGFEIMQQKAQPIQPTQSSLPDLSQFKVPETPQENSSFDQLSEIAGAINPGAQIGYGIYNLLKAKQSRKDAKRKKGYYAEDLAERKRETELGEYVNTPYSSYQMGGNLDAFSQGYTDQQNYNQSVQEQMEEYYRSLNAQNSQKARDLKTKGFQGLSSGISSTIGVVTKVASMGVAQEGGEMEVQATDPVLPNNYNPQTDIYSEDFDANVFLDRKEIEAGEIKSKETEELMKWVFEDTEDNYSPVQEDYMSYEGHEEISEIGEDVPGDYTPSTTLDADTNSIIQKIGYNESRGNYGVVNDVSGTTGKYQFHPRYWGTQIRDFMELPSNTPVSQVMEEFRTNPGAQEGFMQSVVETKYKPQLSALRPYAQKYGFSDEQLIRLMHYRGIGDTKKRLASGDFSITPEEKSKYNNPEILDYLSK